MIGGRLAAPLATLVLLLAFPAGSAAAGDGQLDPAFDGPGGAGNGKFTAGFNAQDDTINDVAVQDDGKIVAVGSADTDPGAGQDLEMLFMRLNSNGSFDLTFDGPGGAGNGRFTIDVGVVDSSANAVAFDSQDRIVVAGDASPFGSGTDYIALRLSQTTGALDTSFSTDGIAIATWGGGVDIPRDVVVDSNDRVLMAGANQDLDFAVARLESDGDLDPTVNVDGPGLSSFDINSGSDDQAQSLVIQADNRVVVAGSSTDTNSDFAIARFLGSGLTPDQGFDGPPTATPSPGNGGFAFPIGMSGNSAANVVTAQGSSKILIGGGQASFGVYGIVRLNTVGGTFDTSFDVDGILTADPTTGADVVEDLAIDSRDRIVAAGTAGTVGGNAGFFAARFDDATGAIDPAFDGDSGSGNGTVTTDVVAGATDNAEALAIEGDGDLVLGGGSSTVVNSEESAFARYKIDLTAPNTFLAGPPALTANADPTFTVTASEVPSFVRCEADGTPTPATCSTGAQQLGPFDDGTHTVTAAAGDEVGNVDPTPASLTFTVDTTAPNGTISGGTGLTGDTTPALSFVADEGGASFVCKVEGPSIPSGAFAPCSSPLTVTASGSPLADGAYTFTLRTTDAAGNLDPTDAEATFTVDGTGPETAITAGPRAKLKAKKKSVRASFSFGSADGVSFECSIDQREFAPCTSPASFRLRRGTHLFSVRARDLAGNLDQSPATRQVKVKRKPRRK